MAPAPKAPIEIAIIGAGIGGLALAIGLHRQNIPFTLYESAASYSAIGAGVGLGPNAQRAIDLISPEFTSLYNGIATGNVGRGKESVLFEVRLATDGFGDEQGWGERIGMGDYERTSAHRKDLLDIMTGLIPLETVKFGKKVTHIKQDGEKVHVSFADGSEITVDAVVGCDGSYRGASRPAVLGDQYSITYAGKYCYRSIVPMADAERILGPLAGDAQMFVSKGRNVLTYPISRGRELNAIAFVMDGKPWTHGAWVHEVERETMIADWEGFVDERLVKLLDVSSSGIDS
jgi:salicylate hydroxylase